MKYKQAVKISLVVATFGLTGLITAFTTINLPATVNAEPYMVCPDGTQKRDDGTPCPEESTEGGNSQLIEDEERTELESLKNDGKECDQAGAALTKDNCSIVEYLVIGINILSAVAGMAIIASIIIAGFQYMTAQDNAGQIEQAKKRIISAIVALLVFIFMYALLDFLVPGGVL